MAPDNGVEEGSRAVPRAFALFKRDVIVFLFADARPRDL